MARESSASSNFSSASVSSACLLRQFLEPCFGVTRFSCFHAFARTWLRSWVCCSCRSNSSIRISRLITLRKQRKRNRILLALAGSTFQRAWRWLTRGLGGRVVRWRVRTACHGGWPSGLVGMLAFFGLSFAWREGREEEACVTERACRK